jgi:hypothetical protein
MFISLKEGLNTLISGVVANTCTLKENSYATSRISG